MWIMTSYGILMPCDLPEQHRPSGTTFDTQVRSRDRQTLRRLRRWMRAAAYETSGVVATPRMDYEFRLYCHRDDLAEFIADEVRAIDYVKFKPTTQRRGMGGRALHQLYDQLWYVIARYHGSLDWTPRRGRHWPNEDREDQVI